MRGGGVPKSGGGERETLACKGKGVRSEVGQRRERQDGVPGGGGGGRACELLKESLDRIRVLLVN